MTDSLNVSLDQARAFEALAREGTFQGAARLLRKGHSAVMYAVGALETGTGLTLLDRSGYRTKLTAEGERVLEACRALLEAERNLARVVHEAKTGWEPRFRIVVDGAFPAEPLLRVVGALGRSGAPTRIDVVSDFLAGVEEVFQRTDADAMVTLLPPTTGSVITTRLPPIRAWLVAHARHPLARLTRATAADLEAHLLFTVRGSDLRLELSTAGLAPRSVAHLNDFWAKRAALLEGLGYGWMPEHLIARELAKRTLVKIPFAAGASHDFRPRLVRRRRTALGKAGAAMVEALTSKGMEREASRPLE
jgi:DNA-binding transcriptional LysR family regulator